MDRFPGVKEYWLIIDNVPMHTDKIIGELVKEHGYKCVYLPPYSPKLNLIKFKEVTIHQVVAYASNQAA
jgi:transposase